MYYCHCAKILDITQSVCKPHPNPQPHRQDVTRSMLQTQPNPTDRTCDANPTPAPKTYRTAHNILGCKPPSPPLPVRLDGSNSLCCNPTHTPSTPNQTQMAVKVCVVITVLYINSYIACYLGLFLKNLMHY